MPPKYTVKGTSLITERNFNMSLNIRNLQLSHGLFLAPMAGVTDRAYRSVCRRHGAEITVTEMVSAKALHYNDESSYELASLLPGEENTFVQLFGHEPDILEEAVEKITNKRNGSVTPLGIDINMGCPMKKIVNNGDGSALMKDPKLIGRIVRRVRDKTSLPLTVKIRAGWDGQSINAPQVAFIAAENGADAVIVHGRTRKQMYCPEVDLSVIRDVKAAVSVPVIGNGGINIADDALYMLDKTCCDGLMLARGTMGNPWLFGEIIARIEGKEYLYPDLDERMSQALAHIDEMIEYKGEHTGVLEARRHLSYYIKNVKGASDARRRLNNASSREELHLIIDDLIKGKRNC